MLGKMVSLFVIFLSRTCRFYERISGQFYRTAEATVYVCFSMPVQKKLPPPIVWDA